VIDEESLSAFRSDAPLVGLAGDYARRSPAELSGEHRLMLAILEDAVAIFVKSLSGSAGRREARAARAWLESRDHSLPFAFEYICDVLGFDSSCLRRGMWALRTRPADAAARLARGRYRRHSGPVTRSATLRELAPRRSGTDLAPANVSRRRSPPALKRASSSGTRS
jgi:hypothetical protein